jgi:hypothetical protein
MIVTDKLGEMGNEVFKASFKVLVKRLSEWTEETLVKTVGLGFDNRTSDLPNIEVGVCHSVTRLISRKSPLYSQPPHSSLKT